MDPLPTGDRPTDGASDVEVGPDFLLNYYTLRLTVPHVEWPRVQSVLAHYTKNYCAALHAADAEVVHEHFHILILEIDDKTIDALRKALRKEFGRHGNEFFAGKKMDNHVYKGLQYMKHDESVTFKHRGAHWQDYISSSPDWEKREAPLGRPIKRAREADPQLSFSNLLWRARAHRAEHRIKSTDLGVTLEHMTRMTNWTPSVTLMRQGLDPLHFKMFEYQVNGKVGKTPDWWTPRIDAFKRD